MKARNFRYVRPATLADACRILADAGGEAVPIAGGQSLLAGLNMRLSAPKLLVDIAELKELRGETHGGGVVRLGALTRHAELLSSELVRLHLPLLVKAAPHIGHIAIRNRGTLGGSISFADPAAELPACMLALGAELEITGPNGRRHVAADDFFKGLFETALGPQDVLTSIRLPAATKETCIGFAEFSRRHGDYAMVGLAASAKANAKSLSNVRLAYFGVGNTPVRAKKAEAALAGGDVDAAVRALAADLDPHDDVQATGATKKHLAGVLLRRVAKQLMGAGA